MFTIKAYIEELNNSLAEINHRDIEAITDIIFNTYKADGQVFIFGNGGSASTSSHFARDLSIGAAVKGKPRIKAYSLTDNVALLTALANDINYESIFKEQLIGCLNKGDVTIGISASGNSPNVLRAIEYARDNGAITIGLIGFKGGKLKEMVHKSIVLSSTDYGVVEDVHVCLAHIISYVVRDKIARS